MAIRAQVLLRNLLQIVHARRLGEADGTGHKRQSPPDARSGTISPGWRCCGGSGCYGRNGWLGLASIWASGSHITQGTVKLNDTYFNTSTCNTPTWRQSVTCQEVGHTFGLDHQSEDPNVNMNTCMDYYRVPSLHPNQHDYDQLALIYSHLDSTTTLAASAAGSGRGLKRVKDALFVEDLWNGNKRFVWVF